MTDHRQKPDTRRPRKGLAVGYMVGTFLGMMAGMLFDNLVWGLIIGSFVGLGLGVAVDATIRRNSGARLSRGTPDTGTGTPGAPPSTPPH